MIHDRTPVGDLPRADASAVPPEGTSLKNFATKSATADEGAAGGRAGS